MGAVTLETPTPIPPINLNSENEYGSGARAEPIADTPYNIPIINRVFFRPKIFVGIPPEIAPITVPHSAIDMINVP
ncbi:hypothetical protein ES708_25611 [subsurface metagenome]